VGGEAVIPAQVAGAPAVEREVAWDMVRRALPIAPVLIVIASVPWGMAGGASAAYAIAIVLVNFSLSAALLGWAARISLPFLMVTALFGYLIRLGLITVAVLAVKDQSWVSVVPLGFTLIITHLGLLFWETRHVSVSLAFPGVKPHEKGN
jgi:hypothetical protein